MSDAIDRALHAYRHEKHNCAQSVLRGFEKQAAIDETCIVEAKSLGGGRAPDGRCGALHAAMTLTDDTGVQTALKMAFHEHAGACTCREIRQLGRLSCEQCVKLAAERLSVLTQKNDTA